MESCLNSHVISTHMDGEGTNKVCSNPRVVGDVTCRNTRGRLVTSGQGGNSGKVVFAVKGRDTDLETGIGSKAHEVCIEKLVEGNSVGDFYHLSQTGNPIVYNQNQLDGVRKANIFTSQKTIQISQALVIQ